MESATTPPSARATLLVLVVVAGALTAGAIVQRDRALELAYEDAESKARIYTYGVQRSLVASDLFGPIEGDRARQLSGEVEDFSRMDPAVARVRLWATDGSLLFSTDPADRPGGAATASQVVGAALARGTLNRTVIEEVSTSTQPRPTPTPLFQTFTPVEIAGAIDPGGVVEIEQFASQLEARADDPWGTIQLGASGATAVLALLAFVSVVRSARRGKLRPSERGRRSAAPDGDAREVERRLERANDRVREAEAKAAAATAQLQQVTARLESMEARSPDDRMGELREALRRSEAERAMLRAGRPETVMEAEVRQLRVALQDARSRAKAAEALAAGKGDLSAVQEQLSTAERETERAVERARVAEGRADAAEEQARLTGELATAAEQRIDLLEAKLQGVAAASAAVPRNGEDVVALRDALAAATERASELERHAAEADARAAAAEAEGAATGATRASDEALGALEERIAAAEARAAEAEERLGTFEGDGVEDGSSFRHTLGVRAAGRKLAAPPPAPGEEPEVEADAALRAAIARGLRGPLTRAAGLTLSLQGSVQSSEGRGLLRQLSSSLRRLDQLAADLHDVRRIGDGTLPLNRRRTDVSALLTTTLEESDHLQEDRLVRLDAERVQATVDPLRLRQIVEGMLEGARDRTRTGASIIVRVRTTEAGIRISVEDDSRAPARVGPEMTLAARLAELHGTELVANGSGFHVVLPPEEA